MRQNHTMLANPTRITELPAIPTIATVDSGSGACTGDGDAGTMAGVEGVIDGVG